MLSFNSACFCVYCICLSCLFEDKSEVSFGLWWRRRETIVSNVIISSLLPKCNLLLAFDISLSLILQSFHHWLKDSNNRSGICVCLELSCLCCIFCPIFAIACQKQWEILTPLFSCWNTHRDTWVRWWYSLWIRLVFVVVLLSFDRPFVL